MAKRDGVGWAGLVGQWRRKRGMGSADVHASRHPSGEGLWASLSRALGHGLPLLLLLSVGGATAHWAQLDWIKSLDTTVMRVAHTYGQRLLDIQYEPEEQLEDAVLTGAQQTVTLLEVTEEGFRRYFRGRSPVPRGHLACMINAIADGIAQAKSPSRLAWTPIVGIDIDVSRSPVEGQAGPGLEAGELVAPEVAACFNPPGKESPHACQGPLKTNDDAMRCALARLHLHAAVVAIAYPRLDAASRQQRNCSNTNYCYGFISDCKAADRSVQGIFFASPHVIYAAGEMVYEFPYLLKKDAPTSGLPGVFPSFGLSLASMARSRSNGDAINVPLQEAPELYYCTRFSDAVGSNPKTVSEADEVTKVLDDRIAATSRSLSDPVVSSYEYLPIRLGKVSTRILEHPVSPSTIGTAALGLSESLWLRRELSDMFKPDVFTNQSIFILALDDGTGRDQFMVPTVKRPVSGAWVHAAIALTVMELANGKNVGGPLVDAEQQARQARMAFWIHTALDLLFGFVFLALSAFLLWMFYRLVRREAWPTASTLAILSIPLFTMAVVLGLVLSVTLWKFSAGTWSNPIPILIGLLIHVYVDAAEHMAGHTHGTGEHTQPHRLDSALRVALQVTWAASLFGCIALVNVTDLFASSPAFGVLAALLAGGLYVLMVRSHRRGHALRFLPLPFRARH